jgi:glycosyltransferase involved in cell wall biosynthesis
MNDLISVVIPIYMVDKFLERCLISVLNQTYSNFEVILVNDGSKDNSESICLKYASMDSRIRYFYQPNTGLSSARNTGLKNAKGFYTTFLDSDDWIDNDYLYILYSNLILNKADIAICKHKKVFPDKILIAPDDGFEKLIMTGKEALFYMYKKEYTDFIVAWGKLFKASLLSDFEFPVGEIHEDEKSIYKLLYKANTIVYIRKSLHNYFQRENSITFNKMTISRLYVVYNSLIDRIEYFKTYNEHKLIDLTLMSIFYLLKDSRHIFLNDISANKLQYKQLYFNHFKYLLFSSQRIIPICKFSTLYLYFLLSFK